MRALALFLMLAHNIYAIPVHEFFSKGSSEYYRINSGNIVDFFQTKLKWPSNSYSVLFSKCREQFNSFGFELASGIKVNVFEINLKLDAPMIQEVSFYCKNSKTVSQQIAKFSKLKLKEETYYYFRWDVLKSELGIYAIRTDLTEDSSQSQGKTFDKLLPIHLSNAQNQQVILFGHITDHQKKAEIHPMMDLNYPVRFDPIHNEFQFSVIEISPFFFGLKTREILKEFNKTFGIIPDRVAIKNKVPVAVMP